MNTKDHTAPEPVSCRKPTNPFLAYIDWLDAEVEAARTVFDERVDAGQDADKTLAAWVRLRTRMADLRKARDLQAEYVLGLTTPLDTP